MFKNCLIVLLSLLVSLSVFHKNAVVFAMCPHASSSSNENMPLNHIHHHRAIDMEAVKNLNFGAVVVDIKKMLTTSQDFWPADFGNYGPFFIRQAWHCAGSYRISDGRGGCDGGRQRFDPELSWDDNTNLDKAKTLLWPIKEKYGTALSWGDLIILTGNVAIESMGGPVLGFCAGRIDDKNGRDSAELGPTHEQEVNYPCEVQGDCKYPLGATTIGLIYVNPEGPMGNPIPSESAPQIRDTFGRMAMNDTETVALIGGGHAFGKAHGACPLGAGPSPKENPANPWPGNCGTGKGNDTFTSGFEGAWTDTPTRWSNDYFRNLLQFDWSVEVGPGGHHQWHTPELQTMMLTSDIALLNDPMNQYQEIVQAFLTDIEAFNNAFAHAWYKLTTRDMGPITRCLGSLVPPPQPFQYPLPPPPSPDELPNFSLVKTSVLRVLTTQNPVLAPDMVKGVPYYGAIFAQLAFQCASTFRVTDYLGGCNGARIRFSPQKDWEMSLDMDKVLTILQPVKEEYGSSLSWADLIVFAGTIAIEESSGLSLPFCPGRTDATDGAGAEYLSPNLTPSADNNTVRERLKISGMSAQELVVLSANLRSPKQQNRSGYEGSWGQTAATFSNDYFKLLLSDTWSEYQVTSSGKQQYVSESSTGQTVYMLPTDLNLRYQPDFKAIAQDYASDANLFKHDFASAWTKLMNIDRFDGPSGNLCAPYMAVASN